MADKAASTYVRIRKPSQKPLPKGHMWEKGSPLKNKTAKELHEMFLKKGFEDVGHKPQIGEGSYLHPKSGRAYRIDPSGRGRYPNEPSHVDVSRKPPYKNSMPKKRLKIKEE